MEARAGSDAREYGRSALVLAAAVGASGFLTYLFFALASHALDREDYGRIVVLWSVLFTLISVLFRPVEQLLSRTIAKLEVQGRSARRAVWVAAQIQLAIACGFLILALLFRDPLEQRLFDGESLFFWSLVASVLGFAASFYLRGYLAGRRWFAAFSAVVLVDAAARAAFALSVTLGIVSGVEPIALGIAIAPGLSALLFPLALPSWRSSATAQPEPAIRHSQEAPADFTLAEGGGLAVAIVLVMMSEQVFLNSGPLFANAELGAAAAGFIFNVLMVARAPVFLFQAVATSLLPHLTRLRSSGIEDTNDEFQASVTATLAAVAALCVAISLLVLLAGPGLMQAAFGDKFEYDRLGLMIIAIGMGFYLGATTLNQAVLAQGQAWRASLCWASTSAALVLWYLLAPLGVFRSVEIGFGFSAVALFVLLYGVYRNPKGGIDDAIEPGSPEELQAQLAAAEEAG